MPNIQSADIGQRLHKIFDPYEHYTIKPLALVDDLVGGGANPAGERLAFCKSANDKHIFHFDIPNPVWLQPKYYYELLSAIIQEYKNRGWTVF